MITTKQQEKLIQRFETLSELELDSVLEELVAHIQKEKLGHLLDKHTGIDDLRNEIEGQENTISDLEKEVDDLRDDLHEIENVCEEAEDIESFEEEGFESLMNAIKKIKSIAE